VKYDSRALVEILEALVNPAQIDAWFQVKPSYFERRPRFSFVHAAIERAESFDQLAPAAIAVARVTSKHVVDAEWGPLLVAALSPGRPAGPLTPAQSAFRLALCQNEALWAPTFGNPLKWFRHTPTRRSALIRLTRPMVLRHV